MNFNIALEIVELALSVARSQTAGKIQEDATLADNLLQIITKTAQAYRDHGAQPANPAAIPGQTPNS